MIDLKDFEGDEEDLNWELQELRNNLFLLRKKYDLTELKKLNEELNILINLTESD